MTIPFRRAAASILTAALFSSQTLFAYQGETQFWSQRAEAARRLRTPVVLAQAPLSAPANDQLWRAPAVTAPGADVALLPALSVHGTPRGGPGASGAFTVIHVQDVHGHAGAQARVAALIADIWQRFPDAPLALEGAAGPFTAAHARSPSGDNAAAGAFLFNLGLISGAERALVGADHERPALGIEDPVLYAANVAAVRQAAPLRPMWTARLAQVQARMAAARAAAFSPELLALDRTVEARRRETIGLPAFAAELFRSRPHPRRYPQTARFLAAWELEKGLDMDAVRRERSAAFEALTARLPPAAMDSLVQAAFAFRAGTMSAGDFHALSEGLFARSGLSLKDAPHFSRYLRYVAAADGVTPRALWKELEALEAETYARLARTPAQKALVADARRLALLQKLTGLSLTAEEWTAYAARRDGTPHFLARWADAAETVTLAPFHAFYESANARDRALAQNFWNGLAAHEGAAVLVAGGFHSDGIEEFLKKKGAVVITVAPKFDHPEDAPDAFALFTRDRTPLESLFEAPKISVPETLSLHPIGRNPRDLSRAEAVRRIGPAVADMRRRLADSGEEQASVEIGRGADGDTFVTLSRSPAQNASEDTVAVADASVEEGLSGAILQRHPSDFYRRWMRRAAAAHQSAQRYFQAARWSRGVKSFSLAVIVGPILLLLPDAAWAYDFVRQGAEVVFTPDRGEHLWGAAQELLRLTGENNPVGARVWEVVQRIAAANPSINDPSLILQGVPYNVPVELLPAAPLAAPPMATPSGVPAAIAAPALPPLVGEVSSAGGLFAGLVQGLAQNLWIAAALGVAAIFAGWWTGRDVHPAVPALNPAAVSPWRSFKAANVLRHISFGRAAVDTLRAPWLMYGVAGWGLLSMFPGFAPFGWVTSQLEVAGFDSFLKILSAFAVFIVFRFAFALRQQVKTAPPAAPDAAFHAWRGLLNLSENWTPRQTNQAIDYARTLMRNHRFQGSGADSATRAVAYHALSRTAQDTAERLAALLRSLPDMDPRSRRELSAKILWFESVAHYAVRARKLVVGSVINVEHIRVKYGGTLRYREILGAYLRRPAESLMRLLTDPNEGPLVVSALKELVGRHVARPLFGMNRRLAEERRKFRARATEVLDLGNRLEPGLYAEIPRQVLEMRRGLFESDLADKDRPGLPGVWDGRNLVSPFLALVFTGIYATYVLHTGTVGLPVIVVAALVGGLGVMALIHRFFIDKGFWDPAYHTESQALNALRARLRLSLGREAENLPGFERLMFDNEREKSEEAFLEEMSLSPASDAVVLVARSAQEEKYFRRVVADQSRRIFPQGVPVLVLRQEGPGTGRAQAQAFAAVEENWAQWREEYPRLEGRSLSGARTLVLFGENGGPADWEKIFGGWTLPSDGSPLTVLELQVMNAYKAARALRKAGEGGIVFFTLDRAYVGPVDLVPGAVNLVSSWKPAEEVEEGDLGLFVTVAEGQVTEIVGEAGYPQAKKYFLEKDDLGRYTDGGGAVQAFAGAVVVSFADPAVFQLYSDITRDIGQTPVESTVDVLDDVLIPLRLLCADPSGKRLYSYLGARGVWSEGRAEEGEVHRRLFNRYERSFRRHPAPPGLLVSLTPPQGSSEFILADRQPLEEIEPAALPRAAQGVNPFYWLEEQAAGRPWIRGVYRLAPQALLTLTMFVLSVRAAVGAPMTREAELALRSFGKWTYLFEWKSGGFGGVWLWALPALGTSWFFLREAAGGVWDAAIAATPLLNRAWAERHPPRRPGPFMVRGRGSDVTRSVLEHPQRSARRLQALIRRLDGADETRHAALRRHLGLAIVRLVPDALLRDDYLEDFDRKKMAQAVGALKQQGRWPGTQAPAAMPRDVLLRRMNDAVQTAFYHQLAMVQQCAGEGRSSVEELKQAAYLMGLLRRWDSGLGREEMLDRLGEIGGISSQNEQALVRAALSQGLKDRGGLFSLPEPSGAATDLRVYRVNELLSHRPEDQAKRRVLLKQLARSVRFFRADGALPVLLIHGRALREQGQSGEPAKRALSRFFSGATVVFKGKLNEFLKNARVVYLEKEVFSPEDVRALLVDWPGADGGIELLTADATPILLDAYAEAPGYRVTLLDLVDGEIKYLDVVGALRRAAEAARVISTAA